MSTTEQRWKLDRVGTLSEPQEFEVTAERMVAYAKATNDDHPLHLSGEVAPPVFAIVPVFMALAPSMVEVVPGEVFMRVVHGEQDFRFHKPIVPGTLRSRTGPVGVHGTSKGVQVVSRAETEDEAGELVVEQTMTAFFRGVELDAHVGEPLTEHGFPDELRGTPPVATVEQGFEDDQTKRYSEASGDPMPIHLDDDFAKSMGLPGIIVHGLCTMAFASRAVVQTACPDDPRRLERLAVRFASVVQPHERITHHLHDAGGGRIHFETTTDAGKVAIKDGLADVTA